MGGDREAAKSATDRADGADQAGGPGGSGPEGPGASGGAGFRPGSADDAVSNPADGPSSADQPVIGWLAVGSGILGIFSLGIVFVPMGLAFSVAAFLAGQAAWGFAGLVLAVIAFFSSPSLITLIGLGAVAAFFGIPGF